ncbi:MAG: chemotaxis protein CheA [Micrococcales bacterium]|nr:chemotaxis protein CheA [Micrococcales bacterium]MCL2668442.1 chemotaxis protein CheA [Micrococcales bacterium]
MDESQEIVREFLVESYENLDQLDRDLVALESEPGSRALLSSIFRTVHTIKGTSGFLGMNRLERVTHVGESLLVELRDGHRLMDQATTDVLLSLTDTVRAILASVESTGEEGDADIETVIAAVEAIQAGQPKPDTEPAGEPEPDPDPAGEAAPEVGPEEPKAGCSHSEVVFPDETTQASVAAMVDVAVESVAKVAGNAAPRQRTSCRVITPGTAKVPEPRPASDVIADPGAPVAEAEPVDQEAQAEPVPTELAEPTEPVAEPVVEPAAEPAHSEPAAQEAPAEPDSKPVPEAQAEPAPAPTQQPVATPAAKPAQPAARPAGDADTSVRQVADTTIRVDVDVLDALMRQVGELVLARNQISRIAQGSAEQELVRAAGQLNLIAGELQEGVMKTRMQPIEHVWSKMPRVVRDLAATCGREVQLQMIGKDTELDRSLLEAVKDPLTHLVRNAVDHGIETPADRVAAGKPAKGTLTLRAYHAGGQVMVEVRDDGRGVDPQKVAESAVRKGLRTAEQVEASSPQDMLQMLFLPGFSTAEQVTKVSGRGVGMDVVKTKIEEIGGNVEIESVPGKGTTCRLRIPLTLAIMPTLTVACGGDVYAVPQVNLVELVALDAAKEGCGIEHVHSAPVYRLRGELLPLVSLAEVLGVDAQDPTVIAVLQAEGRRFGLLLDRVVNTEEIVVKPISARLKSIGLYAGATVLGDGRVALILDVQAIARTSLLTDVTSADDERAAMAEGASRSTEQVLVVGVGGHRVAMPLASVARLEHIDTNLVEAVGGRQVVQYRGTILPLVHLGSVLGAAPEPTGDELLIVVYSNDHRSVGMVVDDILDILDDDQREHSDVDDAGLVGSTVLSGVITELLDVRAAILAVDPSFYDETNDGDPFCDLVGAV